MESKEILKIFGKKSFMNFYKKCILSDELINQVKNTKYWKMFKDKFIDNYKGGCVDYISFVFYTLTSKYYTDGNKQNNLIFKNKFKKIKNINEINNLIKKLDNNYIILFELNSIGYNEYFNHYFVLIKEKNGYLMLQSYAEIYIFKYKKYTKKDLIKFLFNILEEIKDKKSWDDINLVLYKKYFNGKPIYKDKRIKKINLNYRIMKNNIF